MRFIGVTGHGLSRPEDAPAQPRALRLRQRAVPVQLRPDAGPALRRDVRRARGDVRGARRRAADDQEPRPRAVGGPRAHRRRPGTSRSPTRPTSTCAVHWVLGNPQVFLLTTGDVDVLPKLLDAAERFAASGRPTSRWRSSSSRRCSPRRSPRPGSRIQPAEGAWRSSAARGRTPAPRRSCSPASASHASGVSTPSATTRIPSRRPRSTVVCTIAASRASSRQPHHERAVDLDLVDAELLEVRRARRGRRRSRPARWRRRSRAARRSTSSVRSGSAITTSSETSSRRQEAREAAPLEHARDVATAARGRAGRRARG